MSYPPEKWYSSPSYTHRNGSECSDTCNCCECHNNHVEMRKVEELSHDPDYQCCENQIQDWIMNGEFCPLHEFEFMNKRGSCDECNDQQWELVKAELYCWTHKYTGSRCPGCKKERLEREAKLARAS